MLCCLYCHYIEGIHEISVTKVMEGSRCHFFQIKKQGTFLQNEETPQNIALPFLSFRKYDRYYTYSGFNFSSLALSAPAR